MPPAFKLSGNRTPATWQAVIAIAKVTAATLPADGLFKHDHVWLPKIDAADTARSMECYAEHVVSEDLSSLGGIAGDCWRRQALIQPCTKSQTQAKIDNERFWRPQGLPSRRAEGLVPVAQRAEGSPPEARSTWRHRGLSTAAALPPPSHRRPPKASPRPAPALAIALHPDRSQEVGAAAQRSLVIHHPRCCCCHCSAFTAAIDGLCLCKRGPLARSGACGR